MVKDINIIRSGREKKIILIKIIIYSNEWLRLHQHLLLKSSRYSKAKFIDSFQFLEIKAV